MGRNIDEKKKKKKKKNNKTMDEGATNANQTLTGLGNKNLSTSEHEEEEIEAKPSQTRTYPNGLVVEELSMGKPDGKRASGGKQVDHVMLFLLIFRWLKCVVDVNMCYFTENSSPLPA